jgi:hypothetical protein
MRFSIVKYCRVYFRILVTFFFTISVLITHAQNLSNELDSLSTDTIITIEPIDEETEYQDEQTIEQSYFLEKTVFSPDSMSLRRIPDSIVQDLKNDPDFWYADHAFKEKERKRNSGGQKVLEVVLWLIIIGGFAAFIMWYLANSNINLFQKRSKAIGFDKEETETEDIFAINYQKEIDKAVANSNYRLAIRLMYLRLLKNLSEKNIIRYKQERTNFDYLLQLSSTPYYHDFFRVTRDYEYSWYGQFDVNKDKFDIIRNDFLNFERKANIY